METLEKREHVCPVELAIGLDNRLRGALQDPLRILGPHVLPGMSAMDVGCGPGFFTTAMAQLVGPGGHVLAVDLQPGMLDRLRRKIRGTVLERRIELHQCGPDTLGVDGSFDFVLAFYVLHELPDQSAFFSQACELLRPNGTMFVAEPPFHVSRSAFRKTMDKAAAAGLQAVDAPPVRFSKTALLRKSAA